jgi:putative endonuclease
MDKQYYVYIMTNNNNTVLYTGVASDLRRRVFQHRHRICKGFTWKYNIVKLVYYEVLQDPYNAIAREKQIKGGSRKKKTELIESVNPEWEDLYETL